MYYGIVQLIANVDFLGGGERVCEGIRMKFPHADLLAILITSVAEARAGRRGREFGGAEVAGAGVGEGMRMKLPHAGLLAILITSRAEGECMRGRGWWFEGLRGAGDT